MTNKKQIMQEAFETKGQILDAADTLYSRICNAEEKIVELQEESEELKKEKTKIIS